MTALSLQQSAAAQGATLAALLCAAGGVLLVPALTLARRLALPARPLATSWRVGDLVLVLATAVGVSFLARALVPGKHLIVRFMAQELVFASAAGVALVLARRRDPPGLAALGLGPARPLRPIVLGLILYAPLFPLLLGAGGLWALAARRLGWEVEQETLRAITVLEGPELLFALALATTLGPLLEELLFRGFLQGCLVQALGARAGVVACSLAFALLHGRSALPPLLFLSLFLGWLQLRTRTLAAPLCVHALHNGLTLALALATPPG